MSCKRSNNNSKYYKQERKVYNIEIGVSLINKAI